MILLQVPKCLVYGLSAKIPIGFNSFIIVFKIVKVNIHGGCQYQSFYFDSVLAIHLSAYDSH
jgi:hypothetical protein